MQLPPLTPEQQVKPRSFELRISLLFGTLFVPMGVHLPYFPVWLEAQGFDAGQIAIILAAPMFVRVVTTPFITALADEARDRANVLIALIVATALLSCGYFLKPAYLPVLTVSILLGIVWTPHAPLADSLALSGVRRFGSSYPAMRIWGSASFLFGNLAGGAVLGQMGAGAVPMLITGGLAVTLLVALTAPRLGRPRRPSPLSAAELQADAPKLLNRYFVLMAGGAGLIVGSHGFLYGFSSIYWGTIGFSETTIGLLWAWAVVCEVGMFMVFTRIFGKSASTTVIALAGIAAILRWTAMPLIAPLGLGIPGFIATQSLHAFSTALILIGLQRLIAETVPEERTGAAQGIAFFSNSLSMAFVTLVSGPLYAGLGIDGTLVMVLVAAGGLALVLLARSSAPERPLGR